MFSSLAVLVVMVILTSGSRVTRVNNSTNESCGNVIYHVQTVQNLNQNTCCQNSSTAGQAVEDLKQQLTALQSELQVMKAAQSQIPALQAKVHALQTAPAVGFNVALSKIQSQAPATLEFDVVISHYGNCWNSATKMFNAPITGLYLFQLTLMNTSNGGTVWAQIMHESTVLQRAYASGGSTYNVASAAAVVKVNKGQSVYVRLMSGTAHSNSEHWTNFVGTLIQ